MNDSDLESMLRSAGASPPVPEDFQRAVWRRIEARETEMATLPSIRTRSSPWMAIAAMAATIILGAWLGLNTRPDAHDSKADYVRAISPFAHQ